MGSVHSRDGKKCRHHEHYYHAQQNNHHQIQHPSHHHHPHHHHHCNRHPNTQSSLHLASNVSSSSSSSTSVRASSCTCVRHQADKTNSQTMRNQKGPVSNTSRPATACCTSNNNNKKQITINITTSVLKATQLSPALFKVAKLKVAIDKKPTTLDEKSPAVLKYRTPHFRAVGSVEIPPLADKQSVQVGWIQVCTEMQFVNTYGSEGVTSWEFPEIVSGKCNMVSDADGKQYPWYGSKHEIQTLSGPTSSRQLVTVHMNDNFFPQVTWYIPHSSYDKKARLSHIFRKQKFYTFLVVKDLQTDRYLTLKAVSWTMELSVEINSANPPGRRAKLLGPLEQDNPLVLGDNSGITPEACAMKPPNANNSQTLLWRPMKGEPKVIVPPVDTTVDLDKYVLATKDLVHSLTTHAPEA